MRTWSQHLLPRRKIPKTVAQGKKLAEISKAAKKLRMEEKGRKESTVSVDYKFVFGLVCVGVGIAGLFTTLCRIRQANPHRVTLLNGMPLRIDLYYIKIQTVT